MGSETALALPSVVIIFLRVMSLLQKGSSTETHIHDVQLDTLLPDSICSSNGSISSEEGSSMLKLVSRFGPCSPRSNLTRKRNIIDLLQQDHARVKWIQARASGGTQLEQKSTSLPAYSGSAFSDEFIVTIGLGTPKQDFHVLIDTGSDLSWVQCEPCSVSCHPQQGPRFSPSNSSTFRYYSCNSPQCKELKLENYASGCAKSKCLYGISYGDGSTTVGFFGSDTLTLTGDAKFSGFPFGCGENNKGLFGEEAGLLGLGRKKLSLVSITRSYYGGVFSYCLPTTSSPGFLTFGSDRGSKSATYTPLLTNPQEPSFYYVSLLGLSVGGKKLNIPSSAFSNLGTILDSGTVLTYLPNVAYAMLRSEFQRRMSRYTMTRPFGPLDTCYEFSGHKNVSSPAIAINFKGGTNLVLDITNIMIQVNNTQYCLAFLPNSGIGMGIIGNWQQRKTQIVHDLTKSRIGFRRKACT